MSKCKNCAADLRFDPQSQHLKCDSCGAACEVTDVTSALVSEENQDIHEHVCSQCGGSIYTTDSTAATFCSYCGSSIMVTNEINDYNYPESIIPFKISQEEANRLYSKKIRRSFFAPQALKADDVIEKTRGIYMPYQMVTYDSEGSGSVKGIRTYQRGQYEITEHLRYDFGLKMDASAHHDSLNEFSDVISEGIGAFNFEHAQSFTPAYLSGFYADKGDVATSKIINIANAEVKREYQEILIKKMPGRGRITQYLSLPGIGVTATPSVLCPVWFIVNKQDSGDVSYAAVNGQTGQVAAEIPIDKKRFLFGSVLLSILAFIGLILLDVVMTPHKAVGIVFLCSVACLFIAYRESKELYLHDAELKRIGQSKKSKTKDEVINKMLSMPYRPTIGTLKKKKGEDKIPFGKLIKHFKPSIAAIVIAAIIYIINPVHDIVQYVTALGAFGLTLWSFLNVISIHNKTSSRQPAQLGARGGDEDA